MRQKAYELSQLLLETFSVTGISIASLLRVLGFFHHLMVYFLHFEGTTNEARLLAKLLL